MLRSLFFILLGASLLGGCCGNTSSDCRDLLADALYFSFDPSQFTRHEISTVYLARYDATTVGQSLDSLPLPQHSRRLTQYVEDYAGQDTTGLLLLNDNAPFSVRTAGTNLSRYYYRLYVPKDSVPGVFFKQPQYYQYLLYDIHLTGNYQADGCNTCYRNTRKLVFVNGGPYFSKPFVVTEESGASQPKVIPLHKR